MKLLFVIVLIIGAWSNNATDHTATLHLTQQDSLAIFPLNYETKFVGTNSKDQIAILFKRVALDTFTYRIELLRNWKGLPLDHGTVTIQKIESNRVYVFKGGNTGCNVLLTILDKKGPNGRDKVAIIERTCKNSNLNIASGEFPELVNKGGSFCK